MKDELALSVVKLGAAIGLCLGILKAFGVGDISWWAVSATAFGPAALDIIISSLYIIYCVKWKKGKFSSK